MHFIIVEDQENDQARLTELIRQECARQEERVDFTCCASGEEFFSRYRPGCCDAVFLDILLGGVTGIEAARHVRASEPRLPIIFTTTEPDFALDSYAVHAMDYLLKPLAAEKVSWCLKELRRYLSVPSSVPLQETSAWGHASPVDVPFDEILYAQYGNHIMDVHTTLGVFCTRRAFREFTALLPHTGQFYECGRGLVVNLSQVMRVKDEGLLLKNGEVLPYSRRRKQEVQKAFTEWAFACSRKGGLGVSVFWSAVASLIIRAVPAHLMAYYPFRDRLRFPLWRVLLPVSLIQLGQALMYGYTIANGGSGQLVSYGIALVYMALYFYAVRDDRFKVLFLYLFVMDYVMILRGASAFLEARLFYDPGMNFDSWTSVLLNLVLLVVSAPFTLRLFSSARDKVFSTDAPVFWRTAWLVPAFTTAIVMLFTGSFEPENVRSVRFLLARLLLLLCVLVVYLILLDALDGIRRQAALAEQAEMQEQLLNLQRMQHGQLLKHMDEVKTARHDLRQHLEVIWAYLEGDDVSGLKSYLTAYAGKLPADTRRTFTRNFALNAVCTYYAEEARKYGVRCEIDLDMPERLPMSEPEVCALLGNLLENAVEACRDSGGAPFIRVRGKCEESRIILTADNTCQREPVWDGDRLLSTKHEGYGTGTHAVRATAERSGGTAEFTWRDGVFYASVLLYG